MNNQLNSISDRNFICFVQWFQWYSFPYIKFMTIIIQLIKEKHKYYFSFCFINSPNILEQLCCLNQNRYNNKIIEMSERLQESQSQQNNAPKRQYYPETEVKNTEDEQINYYNEYCRLYLANHVLATQLKQLNIEKSQLVSKLGKLQKKAEELSEGNSGQIDQKKRRIRRSAVDIARHYKCQIEFCTKSYGSEGSLNQHIKLKHPEVFRENQKNFIVREFDKEEDDSS